MNFNFLISDIVALTVCDWFSNGLAMLFVLVELLVDVEVGEFLVYLRKMGYNLFDGVSACDDGITSCDDFSAENEKIRDFIDVIKALYIEKVRCYGVRIAC